MKANDNNYMFKINLKQPCKLPSNIDLVINR